jgi:L-alanine-DL-glutamate epimerase-like enolase superfamily enzyme
MSTQHVSTTDGSGCGFGHDASGSSIERLEARLVDVPLGAARGGSGATRLQVVHVTLTTSGGATGSGFTYALGAGAEGVLSLLQAVHAPAVTSLSVWDWDAAWYELRASTHRLGDGVCMLATSAVDIAMWDLRARLAGVPLATLLGSQHTLVPIYGSGRATHGMSDEELVVGARQYLSEGYRAVKLRAGALPLHRDVARVSAVREAVGPEVTLMVDCNERLTATDAQWLSRRLAELDVRWLEEPLPSSDVDGYRALADRSAVPLAHGEHLQGMAAFTPFMASRCIAVAQPDAPITGGVSEFMRVATLAEAHGVEIAPHFLPELHVHLAAASVNATWVEHFPLIDVLLGEVLQPVDGHVAVPDRPGHGMIWNTEALRDLTTAHFDTGVLS